MNTQLNSARPQWTSATGYFLVTLGAIVGIGNIILFPFLVFEYGGIFVLFYLLCELVLAIPLLYAELMVGRRGKQNPVGAISLLAYEAKASPLWKKLGWLYFIVAFFTFSYYVVYVAFPIGFLMDGINTLYGHWGHLDLQVSLSSHVLTDFFTLEACVLFLLVSAMVVVARGINHGLEKISCILVPFYLIILLGLAVYVGATTDMLSALKHLLVISPTASIMTVFFAALTFAFLKLNVGLGSMIVYGSHLPYSVSLKRSTIGIILVDMGICLLCYFVIYPLAKPLDPALFANPLNSHNVAALFAHIPYGVVIASLFFLVVIIASWTVLIAMLETMVATVSEQFNILRSRAVWLISIGLFLAASFVVMCQTTLIDETFLGHIAYPDALREIALEKLLPIAAFFMAIFAGWVVDKQVSQTELKFNPCIYLAWRFLIRYLIPLLIAVIFIFNVFENSFVGV